MQSQTCLYFYISLKANDIGMAALPCFFFFFKRRKLSAHKGVSLYYSTPYIPAVTALTEWLKSAAACQGAISPLAEKEKQNVCKMTGISSFSGRCELF
jgi:hypothetical protein